MALHKKGIFTGGIFQQISCPNYILLGLMLKLVSVPEAHISDDEKSGLATSQAMKRNHLHLKTCLI